MIALSLKPMPSVAQSPIWFLYNNNGNSATPYTRVNYWNQGQAVAQVLDVSEISSQPISFIDNAYPDPNGSVLLSVMQRSTTTNLGHGSVGLGTYLFASPGNVYDVIIAPSQSTGDPMFDCRFYAIIGWVPNPSFGYSELQYAIIQPGGTGYITLDAASGNGAPPERADATRFSPIASLSDVYYEKYQFNLLKSKESF
jgi:hypothetical protein